MAKLARRRGRILRICIQKSPLIYCTFVCACFIHWYVCSNHTWYDGRLIEESWLPQVPYLHVCTCTPVPRAKHTTCLHMHTPWMSDPPQWWRHVGASWGRMTSQWCHHCGQLELCLGHMSKQREGSGSRYYSINWTCWSTQQFLMYRTMGYWLWWSKTHREWPKAVTGSYVCMYVHTYVCMYVRTYVHS